MKFRDRIPDKVLQHSTTEQFIEVIDGTLDYETLQIAEYMRMWNPALITNRDWIFKWLAEYGLTGLPYEYPLPILQQILLNITTLYRLRGSKIGIEFFLSLFSLGQGVYDWEENPGIETSSAFIFNDLLRGTIVNDSDDRHNYFVDDKQVIVTDITFDLVLSSKYFSPGYEKEAELIKGYIEGSIGQWVPFYDNIYLNIEYNPAPDFYYHELLNPAFYGK